tara:strand:+ start:776 stop:1648 length:873 start_codon:yes stop_codon:yes gene_type:complete
MKNIIYLHYRRFGDLVINKYCRSFVRELIGEDHLSYHLEEFYQFLLPQENYQLLREIYNVPPYISVKKSSFYAVVESFFELQRNISRVSRDRKNSIVFLDDKRIFQDFFMRTSTFTPHRLENVYLSHLQAYRDLGFVVDDPNLCLETGGSLIKIFPNASVKSTVFGYGKKSIPEKLLLQLSREFQRLNLGYKVVYLEGEKPADFPHNYEFIPRSFSSLNHSILDSRLVVTCDSLPGHLGNLNMRPTFVLTRNREKYWLPLSTYEYDLTACFHDKFEDISDRIYKTLVSYS